MMGFSYLSYVSGSGPESSEELIYRYLLRQKRKYWKALLNIENYKY